MKTSNNKKSSLSRRDFISKSAKGTLALALTSSILPGVFLSRGGVPAIKSKVVLIRHNKVIDIDGKINQPLVQEMLDTAMIKFSGEENTNNAWLKYFSPEDIIGLKLNLNSFSYLEGTNLGDHCPALTNAIISGCKNAGIKEENFVIWERSDEELDIAGFAIQKEEGALRVMGTKFARREPEGLGFSKESYPVGDKSTQLSIILSDITTSMINMPMMKSHNLSGFTGALKNHYGSISNPREFHENSCTNPGIPEINNISGIRQKEKLIIADAMMGLYDGGPRWNRDVMWPYGGIIVGTDPVAVDYVMAKIIDEKRASEEMLSKESLILHLEPSEKIGLGTCNPGNIDLIEIDLG